MKLTFRISRDFPFSPELGLRFWGRTDSGRIIVPEPIVMREIKEGEATSTSSHGPDLVMWPDSAQQLMDELWHAGVRPTEGAGSAGSLAATQRHLADMRALTAKALRTDLPK